MKRLKLVLLLLIVFLTSGCSNGVSTTKLNELEIKLADLETKILGMQKSIECLNSPITKGVYYATSGESWRLYSLEFVSCILLKTVAYDEYGALDSVRYYVIEEFDIFKFKIVGELVFSDTMGTLSYTELLGIWEAKDDLLREISVSEDFTKLDFGSVNDANKSRRYAVYNVPDKEYWPSRLKLNSFSVD